VKQALIVRHTPSEDAAGFTLPIEQAGYAIRAIDAVDPAFAALDWLAPDLMVIMGGPMGVYERDRHPWIDGELAGIGRRVGLGRPILGVCLGSQMIAAALGARVYPGPVKEVGFAPVALSAAGAASPLRHLVDVPLLHWHGDTFELPADAELLASTHLYPNQAFRIGRRLLALQFHAEMGEDPRIADWIEGPRAGPYLAAAGIDAGRLWADHAAFGAGTVAAGRAMVAQWLAELE